jgi:hypothetical protein
MIMQLSGLEFSTEPPPATAARFIFLDGEGALMPLQLGCNTIITLSSTKG